MTLKDTCGIIVILDLSVPSPSLDISNPSMYIPPLQVKLIMSHFMFFVCLYKIVAPKTLRTYAVKQNPSFVECNKCLIQIKSQIILDYSCATDSEQPSYISTMGFFYATDISVAQGVDQLQEKSK